MLHGLGLERRVRVPGLENIMIRIQATVVTFADKCG